MRRAFSILLSLALMALPTGAFSQASPLADVKANADPVYPGWDGLWEAQPELMRAALAAVPRAQAGRANHYVLAVAAGGAQQLFARKAALAAKKFTAYFGEAPSHALTLSNGYADLERWPLATVKSLDAVAQGLGERMEGARDIAIVYLAAHGSEDAALATDLPNYQALRPIDAKGLAAALDRAGVRRRIIIVSACFSGSWIPALANDDSIVLTAAASDRTSFGCSDDRELTFFGAAFLKRAMRPGVPLARIFDQAKAILAGWEKKAKLTPSNPQVRVGSNMQALWEIAPARR